MWWAASPSARFNYLTHKQDIKEMLGGFRAAQVSCSTTHCSVPLYHPGWPWWKGYCNTGGADGIVFKEVLGVFCAVTC